MPGNGPNDSKIVIDESKHKALPSTWQRLKNAFGSIIMGVVFAQVMSFAFRMGSVIFYFLFYLKWVIAYLLICAVLGWIYGDKFIQTLGEKSSSWWNLWNYWK